MPEWTELPEKNTGKRMSHATSHADTTVVERISAVCRAKLRACATLGESSLILAENVAKLSGALNSTVFLLDYTKQHLVCSAVSPDTGKNTQENPSIPVDTLHDPLCFCLNNGQPYKAAIIRDALFPSSAYLHTDALNLEAIPLLAREKRIIGVLLLSFGQIFPPNAAVYALCDYGAMSMASIMQKECSTSVMHSLENDLVRLQKRAEERANRRMIGENPAMLAVGEQIAKVAHSNVHVLITGETGTGKELAAEIIHASSRRSNKAFLKINCGALPAPLLESELFGHKKGAFTGAVSNHKGLLRSADGGTVLLDEIGEMPVELQVKLLRFLQENRVRPLGGVRHYPLNIRIIAATNVDVQQAIASGTLRPDLYHRLAVVHIKLPSLDERREDIPALALHFLEKTCATYHRPALSLSPELLAALCEQSYPGNVRELAASIERAVLMTEPDARLLELKDISPSINDAKRQNLIYHVARYESLLIANALKQHGGNISEAAKELGIPRSTLRSKIQTLSLEIRR